MEIEKYESELVKVRCRKIIIDNSQKHSEDSKHMDNRVRQKLSLFFSAWLQQHLTQKEQWKKSIRVRFVINQSKARRIF